MCVQFRDRFSKTHLIRDSADTRPRHYPTTISHHFYGNRPQCFISDVPKTSPPAASTAVNGSSVN